MGSYNFNLETTIIQLIGKMNSHISAIGLTYAKI